MKKLITTISLLGLIINATPLMAWTIDIEVLGGGYKIDTASVINFNDVNTSTSDALSTINFISIEDPKNYIMITDENGSIPYDVTITGSQLKLEEIIPALPGGAGPIIKIENSSQLKVGDQIFISNDPEQIYSIQIITDNQTIGVDRPVATPINGGDQVNVIVNCDKDPQKCISLNDFQFASGTAEMINGSFEGIITDPFLDFSAFGGETTTTSSSIDNTLNLVNPAVFEISESIDLILANGSIETYEIISVNADSVSIDGTVPVDLEAGLKVRSSASRAITLAKGTGGEASQYKIFPTIQANIRAGQKPGKYVSTLYLSIF